MPVAGKIYIDGRIRIVASLTKAATPLAAGQKATFPTGVEEYLEIVTRFPDNPKYFKLEDPLAMPLPTQSTDMLNVCR